ncbi:E3 ubiquitin-protein ligase TRIM62-like [Apus apus]|uniref:E3 ubiquitin-protein ligase TRIM62-like n=1 Tax=Apus apus TaxID=8895 RepID=UPI0021F8F26C|nr:E3 ubiquitin-protein ligase TRIM62-like [Apus apus]
MMFLARGRSSLPAELQRLLCYPFQFHFLLELSSLLPAALRGQSMAELGPVAGLKEELTCPVCLGIYSNPVSLSCGHSFCKKCIQEVRRHQQGPFSCPLCQALADPTMELQTNIQLRSIAQKFLDAPAHQEEEKGGAQEKGEGSGQQNEAILCDSCLEEPQPAVKTCLNCEASLCQAHLTKHNTRSPLKDHVLVEPCDAQLLAERRCPQHGKLLECYCQTDSVCICVLCSVTSSHKNHEITALEEAFGQAQSAFCGALETVKTRKAALRGIISNLLTQEDEVETTESQRRNQLESLFEEMGLQLVNKKEEVLRALRHNEEQQLSQIQRKIQNYKEEEDAASHDVQELEALRDQKDPLLFTKTFAAIQARKHKPVPKKVHVKLPKPPFILNESTAVSVQRLYKKFLLDVESSFATPPVHEHLSHSHNQDFGRSSSIVSAPRLYSPHFGARKTYTSYPYVESNQSFSEGSHFWEVQVSQSQRWKVGIIQENLESYLEMSGGYLSVFIGTRMITRQNIPEGLEVVRVELDCRTNQLSFYNATSKDGDPTGSLWLIETLSIPPSYPAHAIFGAFCGSLEIL